MHLCNPRDTRTCNSWCHGPIHVDLAYCDCALLAEVGIDPLTSFYRMHAAQHARLYQTPPCTILGVVPAPEAPTMDERYPDAGVWQDPMAYRVTYQVHAAYEKGAPHACTPLA
jgi:hypothetical protein